MDEEVKRNKTGDSDSGITKHRGPCSIGYQVKFKITLLKTIDEEVVVA